MIIDSLMWGGAELLLAELATAAPAAGIELSVAHLSDQDGDIAARRLRRTGIEPERIPVRGLLNPASLRSVRAHISSRAPDVVHTHLQYADVLGIAAARSLGIPSLSTLHVMRWSGDARERARAELAGWVRRRCAYRVIAVSEAARRAYLARGWDSPGHVVTIPNGSAAQPRPGDGRRVRAGLGLGEDDLVVGMLTVLRPGKGHALAAQAVGRLRARHPRLRLLVAGDGPARADIARELAPLAPGAVMAGHRDDPMAVLDACDVLVHPSSFDAFPTTLIEAMAAGVPVVATRVGGIPEIVVEGETGLLIDAPPAVAPLAAALEALLDDAPRRRAMGERGRERHRRKLTASGWVRSLAALYREALAARQPGARGWRSLNGRFGA